MSAAQDEPAAFGVKCRSVGSDSWTYISVAPWPQLSPDGTPMLSLLTAGDVAFVQLSAQLDPPGGCLELLRAKLARPPRPTAAVTLTNGVSAVRSVEVTAGTGDHPRVIVSSPSSGYAPYTAVFSIQATSQDREQFEAALRGETGHIAITYDVETDRGPAKISADLADWTRTS